jgi:hypothetical protein
MTKREIAEEVMAHGITDEESDDDEALQTNLQNQEV